MAWLSKLLFPQSQPHEQRRKLRALRAALFVGLFIAGLLALVFYWAAVRSHR